MKGLKELFEHAWKLRWAQEIEATVEVYTQIQRALDPSDESSRIEADLIWISLLRAQGKNTQSQDRLKKIDLELSEGRIRSIPHHFYFERALSRYVNCDYIGAYEDFSHFYTKAHSEIEIAAASINKLLCLENMGFDTKNTEIETNKILDGAYEKPLPWPQMQRHLTGFDYRKSFKNGDFRKTLEQKKTSFDYANYFSQFIRLLPYHADSMTGNADNILQTMLTGSEHLYHKSFRLRTLTYRWHPDDLNHVFLSDLSERLYLWVWTWMTNPERVSAEKIGFALKSVAESKSLALSTPLEAALLRNAIGWISLFNRDLEPSLRAITMAILSSGNSQTIPLLDLEYSMITALKTALTHGKKMMEDNLILLTSHPLWSSDKIYFNDLFELVRNREPARTSPVIDALKRMADRLRPIIFKDEATMSETELRTLYRVRLSDYSIESLKTGNRHVSETLVKAIVLLSKTPSVHAHDLMRECYGIRTFDPLIHHTKLYNLVSRVKGVLSGIVTLKTRQSIIYTEGAWSKIEIDEIDPMVGALREETKQSAEQIATSISRGRKKKSEITALLDRGRYYNREELHEIVGGSRATAIRRINELVKKKIIERIGKSRSTKYILPNHVKNEERK